MFLAPLYNPIPMTLPIITCDAETGTIGMGGRPALTDREESHEDEKMNKTRAWDSTVTSAASDESSIIPVPTVSITFLE